MLANANILSILSILNILLKRFFRGRNAAKNIREERETLRRWSRRSFEDRFTL